LADDLPRKLADPAYVAACHQAAGGRSRGHSLTGDQYARFQNEVFMSHTPCKRTTPLRTICQLNKKLEV
jgi:hypothetical protein